MLDQERSDDHPNAVVHPARPPQLAHPCVDNGIARLPLLPGVKSVLVFAKGKIFELGPERFLGEIREMEEQVVGEFPPRDFSEIGVAHIGLSRRFSGGQHRMPDLARAYFAEGEVRGKPGGASCCRDCSAGRGICWRSAR